MPIVLERDTYHAGKINWGRASLYGNDEWEQSPD
jgi:hypothetical protein|tara:strand:- start:2278 stop:2379 length:102 start_codon:yes stop_codon:yes gene_type:complete